MTDIGWFSDADGVPDGRDACLGSPRSATVKIGSCVSTAPNTVFANGCRVADLANDCADQAKNHGSYISCIEHLEHALLSAGVLTKDEANVSTAAPSITELGPPSDARLGGGERPRRCVPATVVTTQ